MSGPDIAAGADPGQAPVGLAAVGLGRWARVMAQAYAGSPLVELRTCYTRNPERRQAFAADFGCGQDESLDALLDRDNVDGIVITAPNDQHAPIIEAAAARGKHVYTEKRSPWPWPTCAGSGPRCSAPGSCSPAGTAPGACPGCGP